MVLKISGKASLLATFIFNILVISKTGLKSETLLIIFLSFVIFSMISLLSVIFTIYPFYLIFENKKASKKEIFNKFFPYYSLSYFTFCVWVVVYSQFIDFAVLVSITTFFTAIFSWVWMFTDKPA